MDEKKLKDVENAKKINSENNKEVKKSSKAKKVIVGVACVVVVAGVATGLTLNRNKILNSTNENEVESQSSNTQQISNNGSTHTEGEVGSNIFTKVTESNFKNAEVGILKGHLSYSTINITEYSTAIDIINAIKDFDYVEKDMPVDETNIINIYFYDKDNNKDENISIYYLDNSNEIYVSTGRPDTYKTIYANNIDLTKLTNIINKLIGENSKITNNETNKTITINKKEVSFEIPQNWKDTYSIVESTNEFGKEYTIKNIVNGKEVTSFEIAITTEYSFGESSWKLSGTYEDKKVYSMNNYICRDGDGNTYNNADYKHEEEVANVIKSIKINDTNKYNYLTLSAKEFQLRIPKSWAGNSYLYMAPYSGDVEKMGISQNANAEYYKMEIITRGKLTSTSEDTINAFTIMITDDDSYLESSWAPVGKYNGKNVLVMQKFVCRDGDGNTYSQADYDLEEEIIEVIKSISIR